MRQRYLPTVMNNHLGLQGLRVLNTRPYPAIKELSAQIRTAGGQSIEFPLIAIEALNNWVATLPALITIDVAIFLSPNAVNYFFSTLSAQNILWSPTTTVIAIGEGSAKALRNWQIAVDLIPTIADSEHLLALSILQAVQNKTILICKGDDGRPLLSEILTKRGANLKITAVYKRVMPKIRRQYLTSLICGDKVDIILFTNKQAIDHMWFILGRQKIIFSTPCLVLSTRLANYAAKMGMQKIIISNYNEILTTLKSFKQGLNYGK